MKKTIIIFLLNNFFIEAIDVIWLARQLTQFNIENWKAVGRIFTIKEIPASQTEQTAQKFDFSNLAGTVSPEVKEIADFIAHAEKYSALGARMPKGILLYGPPGTGKTSLARALAGETNAAFFATSGSQFIEMYVGVGPARIRELFNKARAALDHGAPASIIFIDEIDAIGGKRDFEPSSEYRNTLNELLTQLDGFAKDARIFVIAATNTIDLLDPALIRPGRFDRHIKVELPSQADRYEILNYFLSKTQHEVSLATIEKIAQDTPYFSPPELENIVNETAIYVVRENRNNIQDQDLLFCANRIIKQKAERKLVRK